MACFKILSLVLVFSCLAVMADNQQEEVNVDDDPRVISEQDLRLFFKPLNFLTVTPTKAPRPIIVYPQYPQYPQYPIYRPHDPVRPTYAPKPTTKPPATNPYTDYPPYPYPYPYPIKYPYPHLPQLPVNPWHKPGSRPPYIIVLQPPIYPPPNTANGGNTGANGGAPAGGAAGGGTVVGGTAGGGPAGVTVVGARLPFLSSAGIENSQAIFGDEEPQYDLVDDMSARNIKVDGVSITPDSSKEDKAKDTLIVDTKDIKLPFGITIGSSGNHDLSNKKHNEQEALIYLRNYKKGRKLMEPQLV